MSLPPVCILAGGLGTRLGEVVRDTPKPLLEVAGEPFLVHQLRLLASQGIDRAVLCVGYLGERIEQVIGPRCARVEVAYRYDDPASPGTFNAVAGALDLLGERFLVLYGDTYLRCDYAGFAAAWAASKLAGGMTVLHNRDRLGPSNAVYDPDRGLVVHYSKQHRTPAMEWIDYGLGALEAGPVAGAECPGGDLAELYRQLAESGEMFGYEVTERFYEIGTPDALAETDAFLRSRLDPASSPSAGAGG